MKGFLMSVEIAEKFFKRCAELEANTLEERMTIMNRLIHEENIQIIKENQMKAITKDKTVLFVRKKGNK